VYLEVGKVKGREDKGIELGFESRLVMQVSCEKERDKKKKKKKKKKKRGEATGKKNRG